MKNKLRLVIYEQVLDLDNKGFAKQFEEIIKIRMEEKAKQKEG